MTLEYDQFGYIRIAEPTKKPKKLTKKDIFLTPKPKPKKQPSKKK